jgi:hypothetical protein
MTSYDIQNGDTLGAIAERMGHPGEWRALALANIGQVQDDISDEAKVYVVAERMYVGQTLDIPLEWEDFEIEPPASTAASTVPIDSSMSAAQLVQLAQQASTLAELDAIDAAASGRATVLAAVDQRRATLLDQGATT